MVNGWDWIEEGQRIAEATRRAGELDIEAIKATSIAFQQPATRPQGSDLLDVIREVEVCRSGGCEWRYKENEIGGEARYAVGKIARIVGQPMSPPLDRNVWSPANMGRVIAAVQELANENEALRKQLAERNQKDNRTVAALREALIHAGEAV